MDNIINVFLVGNLILSFINAASYTLSLRRLTKTTVIKSLSSTKRLLMFEFIVIIGFTVLQALAYLLVIFLNEYKPH